MESPTLVLTLYLCKLCYLKLKHDWTLTQRRAGPQESVLTAMEKNNALLRDRPIKVVNKRTNLPAWQVLISARALSHKLHLSLSPLFSDEVPSSLTPCTQLFPSPLTSCPHFLSSMSRVSPKISIFSILLAHDAPFWPLPNTPISDH